MRSRDLQTYKDPTIRQEQQTTLTKPSRPWSAGDSDQHSVSMPAILSSSTSGPGSPYKRKTASVMENGIGLINALKQHSSISNVLMT